MTEARTADVIVVGGGISGTATAWQLAQVGVKTLLLERGDLASMASGWTLAGVRQSGRHPAELPLAQAAIRRWEHLHEELGVDVEYRQEGNLRLALTEDDLPKIRAVVDEGNAAGIETIMLEGADAVREVAPAVTPDLFGASLCPTDGHANPSLVVQAFADAGRRAGAEIRTGVQVLRLVTEGDRVIGVETGDGILSAGVVVLAAGIYTPTLLAPLGLAMPISVTMVAAVQSVPVAPTLKQVLGLASGGVAGRQQVDGRYRFTGSTLPWGEAGPHTADSAKPSFAQVQDTIARTIRVLPSFADVRVADVWGGLLDQSPDALPVFDAPREGLVMAAGFSGHGFCLGPITGEILADLAVEGETAHPIAPFTLSRFAGTTEAAGVTLNG
ncbi:MAG TPA: FAD-binding oxidoreductase [Thermomicrobiales bacterium]|nr:FAD-binding oxidoreductase [Thermomicrobiales bacterium]